MNMFVFVFGLTALILCGVGMITDGWDWMVPVITILGIIWCFVDCVREEKETAHRER